MSDYLVDLVAANLPGDGPGGEGPGREPGAPIRPRLPSRFEPDRRFGTGALPPGGVLRTPGAEDVPEIESAFGAGVDASAQPLAARSAPEHDAPGRRTATAPPAAERALRSQRDPIAGPDAEPPALRPAARSAPMGEQAPGSATSPTRDERALAPAAPGTGIAPQLQAPGTPDGTPARAVARQPEATTATHQQAILRDFQYLEALAERTAAGQAGQLLPVTAPAAESQPDTFTTTTPPTARPVTVRARVAHELGPAAPAVPPAAPGDAQAAAGQAPTIHVSIGRVEIRAVTPAPQPRRAPAQAPAMSLDEYLRRRQGHGESR